MANSVSFALVRSQSVLTFKDILTFIFGYFVGSETQFNESFFIAYEIPKDKRENILNVRIDCDESASVRAYTASPSVF